MKTLAAVALLAVLLAIQPGGAGDYNVRTRQTYNNNHQTHRQIVRLTDVVRIDPAYTSAYDPTGYDTATQQLLLAELHKIAARLDANAVQRAADQSAQAALLQRLTGRQDAPAAIVPPAAPPPAATVPPAKVTPLNGLAVLNLKCAACHQEGKLKPNQRFILLDAKGQLNPLTPAQRLNVIRRTYQGTMPPLLNEFAITPVVDVEEAAIIDIVSGN